MGPSVKFVSPVSGLVFKIKMGSRGGSEGGLAKDYTCSPICFRTLFLINLVIIELITLHMVITKVHSFYGF